MAGSDEGFISRWSRRKEEAREPEREEEAPPASQEDQAVKPEAADEAEVVAQLPDIDSLDETSDFSAFMKEGVPQALKRKALRRLWRVNPVFSFLDGMNEYDEDFNIVTTGPEGVKTIYQVGKGMLGGRDEEEPAEPTPAEDEVAEGPESAEPQEANDPAEEGEQDDDSELPDPPEVLPAPDTDEMSSDEPLTVADAHPQAESAGRPPRGSARARRWGALED